EHPLRPDDELCLFPPVSGGRAADVYRGVGTPLSAGAAAAGGGDPGAGGVGRLDIGEASLLIAVAAAHRAEAFEACRYAIDTLKATVPVWKKEHFEDGEVWGGRGGGGARG